MDKARIASLLRNNGWALDLAVIALCAYFFAGTANAMLARALRPVPNAEDSLTPVTAQPARMQARAPLKEMAERNVMRLKRETLAPPPGSAPGGAPDQPVSDLTLKNFRENELAACTMAGVLRATLVADKPELSVAVIVRNDTREPQAYTINDGQNNIADDTILVAIRSREVVIRRRDHFERCDGEGELPAQATPNTIAASGDGPPGTSGEVTGVTKMSPTDYKVERAEVDRALSNLNEVATQARIVPSFKNGKPNGFKMFSIKPGSIYSKIGLTNGDVIQKINGYDMNSPDRALEIYTKLRDATSLSIELQRGGTTQTMNYAIN
jgi:general secretion pathway protein C